MAYPNYPPYPMGGQQNQPGYPQPSGAPQSFGFEGVQSGNQQYPPMSGYPGNDGFNQHQSSNYPSYPPAMGGPQQAPVPSLPYGSQNIGPPGYGNQTHQPTGYPSQPPGSGYNQQGYPGAGMNAPPAQGFGGYPSQSQTQSYSGYGPPGQGGPNYPQQQPPGQGGPNYPQQQPPGNPNYWGAQSGGPPPTGIPHGTPSYGPPHGGPGGQQSGSGGSYGAPQAGYGGTPSNNYNQSAGRSHHTMTSDQGFFSPQNQQGTVRAAPGTNANADSEALHKAMKGFGCDDKTVMNVLCARSNDQRQQIKKMFKTMYGKDLIHELIKELKGHFEEIVVALMDTPAEFDAKQLRKAMAGMGTTESTLIEILCTRTNKEIEDIKMSYRFLFARDLEKDLISETSGDFKRLLVSMVQGGRDESSHVDATRARTDAERLYKAGEKRLGTDESMFNAILAAQNFSQLQQVFKEYQRLTGHDIEKAVANEFSGDVLDGYMTVVKCVKNRPAYFAERLHYSMKGFGTSDDILIRVIVSRCERDMMQIKQEFQRMYNKSLESFISGDTSGAYKNALLKLVQGN